MRASDDGPEWFEDYDDGSDDVDVGEYDLTATPNDFNVATIFNYIDAGVIKVPAFQRNFVWDLGRSSKLIESLILGLPVPQLFLYEEAKNSFLVIDGQQRLLSIYYFMKGRFPRIGKRVELRRVFDEEGGIPLELLDDEQYFEPFKLKLPERLPERRNKLAGLSYVRLGDYKTQFELRPVRNVIVKQSPPRPDDTNLAMFEIFNRLNTGGYNLKAQEIRTSLYHTEFYNMLYRINEDPRWRRLLWSEAPDLHMKDVEVLLRGFAMLADSANYAPSMVKFLNQFSHRARSHSEKQNHYLRELFVSFLAACEDLSDEALLNKQNRRFNIALYEAVFTAACEPAFGERALVAGKVSADSVRELEDDQAFRLAALEGTTRTGNVEMRLGRARSIIRLV
jgi:hypothetical protein